ncbi:hypothetical protein QCB44_07860 [Thiomicrorhabdus sp. zzn3]|uniref:hypothetical protein n=1 Tax=Thiomicrorhabdus sp. zzn3 TaxID=3039775 RepID=UPI002436A7EC|nr:hypothetical protein [Thiomicrorhabdus sp. zzn3]MDG6778617.1 hypothetical protein [Thiomicrorhabdus sp. zzn3]
MARTACSLSFSDPTNKKGSVSQSQNWGFEMMAIQPWTLGVIETWTENASLANSRPNHLFSATLCFLKRPASSHEQLPNIAKPVISQTGFRLPRQLTQKRVGKPIKNLNGFDS